MMFILDFVGSFLKFMFSLPKIVTWNEKLNPEAFNLFITLNA